jgi:hypothetical protein
MVFAIFALICSGGLDCVDVAKTQQVSLLRRRRVTLASPDVMTRFGGGKNG